MPRVTTPSSGRGVAVGAGGRAVDEDRHRDHEQPPGAGTGQLEARLPARRDLGHRPRRLERGRARIGGRAGHRPALGVGDHDARVAVRGGDAGQVPGERLLVPTLAGEERAHRGERGEHLRVGAPGREPARDEPGPVGRDGGDARLPVQQRGLALGADLVGGEEDDQHAAGDEGADVDPRDSLAAGGPALDASPLPARASMRHAFRIAQTWFRSISSLGWGRR